MPGLYIHIPFCKKACHYCDFHFSTSLNRKSDMVEAIIGELHLRKHEFLNVSVDTIYFGGGTPSLLIQDDLERIFKAIHTSYKVSAGAEISLEANPDDLSQEKIKELADSPINRLSIGVQSFFDEDLKMMNRAHSYKEAVEALENAKKYFKNIMIDLIYGIPGLTNQRWHDNLKKTFELEIPHISSYSLTVEPKTVLASLIKNGKYPNVDAELAAQHFGILVEETKRNDFVHYEISNFGKESFFSKHNSAYWQGEKYLGIGPSAHSYFGIQRSWNISNNAKYVKAIRNNELPSEHETLSTNDQFNERIMIGLRTIWGVSLEEIELKFGKMYLEQLLKSTQKFLDKKLLFLEDDCLKTTQQGKFLCDGIAAELFVV